MGFWVWGSRWEKEEGKEGRWEKGWGVGAKFVVEVEGGLRVLCNR